MALADHNKCIELSPDTGEFYKERGMTYYLMDRKVESEADYATARRLDERTRDNLPDVAVSGSRPASNPRMTDAANPSPGTSAAADAQKLIEKK